MTPLSAFVTTFNNGRTIGACLDSVAWADEIVVLDSFSTDDTVAKAEARGARVFQHEFLGYGPQKQMALEHTTHDWVLLLDADEALSPALAAEIRTLLERGPDADGYTMRRHEQQYWKMSHPGTRMNRYLRLFDKRKGEVTDMPVHAAPRVAGRIDRLEGTFYHFGETDIHTKVDKLNHYSSGLVGHRIATGRRHHPALLVVVPPYFFLRSYLWKRGFLNGWAGFVNSVLIAFYAFLKYAKVYERGQFDRHGWSRMPPGAPPAPPAPGANERDAAERAPPG